MYKPTYNFWGAPHCRSRKWLLPCVFFPPILAKPTEVYIVASSLSIVTRAWHWCIRALAANLLVPTSSKRRPAMDGRPVRFHCSEGVPVASWKDSLANSKDGWTFGSLLDVWVILNIYTPLHLCLYIDSINKYIYIYIYTIHKYWTIFLSIQINGRMS